MKSETTFSGSRIKISWLWTEHLPEWLVEKLKIPEFKSSNNNESLFAITESISEPVESNKLK